ncbi:related to nitrilase [Cephalotrichum gorgonifer]|uniref:Related to nitrilase n=1 Tax=Cephalotrichum gorgonifer TaxID=2041049 RepID=A0AAE8SW87_9PEZI|nr:related to nitrilase [Cephalotrichum gorgonifer]
MPTIRLATSSPATKSTTAETLAELARVARNAASGPNPADILLLPEAFLGGYPRGATFDCAVGERSRAGRDQYLEYFKGAVDLGDVVGKDGGGGGDEWVRRELGKKGRRGYEEEEVRGDGTREELERIANETGVFIIVGCVEKAGGSLYCSAVYVCPVKGIIGKRRKVMPTGSERLVWAQGSASTLRAVTTTIRGVRINLAAAICWENYMPLLRQAIYSQNVNLYLAPTADSRDSWLSLIRTIAFEGRCFVVSSNMAVRPGGSAGAGVPKASASRTNTQAPRAKEQPSQVAPVVTDGEGRRPSRRRSIPCGDGNEIILPVQRPVIPHMPSSAVLEEDEDEVVLPEAKPPRPAHRRSSIVCTDGREMPYPPSISNWPPGPDPDSPSGDLSPKNTAGLAQHPKQLEHAAADKGAKEWACRGGSCIVDPLGNVLAGPQWEDDEGIIYADVDFEDCIRGRLDLDVAGSYSRNDSFKFSVEGLDLEALPY